MAPGQSVIVRLEVESVEPRIWRVVRVPGDLCLDDFHRVLLLVMGWSNRHPHTFEINARMAGTRRSSDADGGTHVFDAATTIAATLAIAHDRLIYVHKAAQDWRIRITRAAGAWPGRTKSIICLDGYLASPRDDCDSPATYNALLAAMLGRGLRLTEAQLAHVGPHFDPERFDRCAINRALAELNGSSSAGSLQRGHDPCPD